MNFSFFSPKTKQTLVRPTRYAGSWYQSDGKALRVELEEYLRKAAENDSSESRERLGVDCPALEKEVMALIVPHAGYMFSGATAAYAYKAASGQKPERIFLLGPSHHVGFRGAALSDAQFFATPLGDIELDRGLIQQLSSYQLFSVRSDVHAVEHSLELQLPYLKLCFPDSKLVPVVIGQIQSTAEARLIGEIIRGFIGKNDLVVVSSDFTHYGPRYDYLPFAPGPDLKKQIGSLDARAFDCLKTADLEAFDAFLLETGATICGMYPCQVLLSMLPKAINGTLLNYATSQDSMSEEAENSVSYLALAFGGGSWAETGANAPGAASNLIDLSDAEKEALLALAWKTMEIFVREKRKANPEEFGIVISPRLREPSGAFVSLYHKAGSSEHKELRGCIGSIYPTHPLYQAVQENAIAACSRDYRFEPVSAGELFGLHLEVNVLTAPRRVNSADDIVVGLHGVILSKEGRQAVFLPQVALEWGWSKEEMLSQLAQKAGLRPDAWRSGASFDVFQSLEIG